MKTYTKEELKEFDKVEKWIMLGSLQGIPDLRNLWNSGEDEVCSVIDILEQISLHKQLEKDRDRSFICAQNALKMGIDYDMISRYDTYRNDKEEAEAQAIREDAERNNQTLNDLAKVYNYIETTGPSEYQQYWNFRANIGHGGVYDYRARLVILTWTRLRIWLEWTDENNKKHKQSIESSRNQFSVGKQWPEHRIPQYGSPNFDTIPYLYTEQLIADQLKKEAKKNVKRKRKSTV